jgi:hypothetical protein
LAKIFEHFDAVVFNFTGGISGHSVKHVVAALGIFFVLQAYRNRERILTFGLFRCDLKTARFDKLL